MDVLDKSSACAIAIAMRGVDPDKLGAAAAVPLTMALMRYESDCNNPDESGVILSACFPHVLAVTRWTNTVPLKLHLGLPSSSHITALHAAARLCQIVADFLNLSREERREKKYLGAVKRLPLPEALALDTACLAACASHIARRLMENELHTLHPSKVLGLDGFGKLIDAAVVAALMSLYALRLSCQIAGYFPHDAASPTANTISNLLPIPQLIKVDKAFLQALSNTASLLTEVAGSLTQKQAAQLAADVLAAADVALVTVGIAEAVEQCIHPGLGAAQPKLTSEGQQHQQAVAEAPAPQLQQLMSLRPAISHVVAITQLLAALSRGLLPSPKRTALLARLLRWAVDMQRLHPLLLMQQPVHSFEDLHPDNGATRNELLSDQVLDVADAAAHGIAAAVVMRISAGIRRRCRAVAAAGRSRGAKTLPPCAPDAQLAAALPAIGTLVNAQAHCNWGDEPPGGAWHAAHAMVTLAGHLADVLADADRMAAGSSSAAAGSSAAASTEPAEAAQPAAPANTEPDALPARLAGSGGSSPADAESQAAWRVYTAAAGQPGLDELVGTAVTGAVVVAGWAAKVLKQVQRGGSGVSEYSNRLEKAAAELRPARLGVAAAGVLRDLAKCEAGRAALLEQRQFVLQFILPPLEAALNLKNMHQGAAATAELAALVHDVAGLVGLLLTPDAPPAAEAQRSIDSWRGFAADVQKRPQSVFPRELLRAVAAVSKALQGGCTKPNGSGTAEAGQTDAEAAADAVAAALIQDERDAAAAAPGQGTRQQKGKKGRGGNKK